MLRRLLFVACPALLLLALIAPQAQAKGAESVTISGPGVDDVTMTYVQRGSGISLDSVAAATRIYDVWDGANAQRRSEVLAPTVLGPAYTVDYDFFGEHVVQTVFPFASPHPAIYFLPGQELYDEKVASRWLRAPPELRRMLVRLGAPVVHLPAEVAVTADDVVAEPAEVEAVQAQAADDGAVNGWWLGFAAMTAIAAALGWGRWRRRQAPVAAVDTERPVH